MSVRFQVQIVSAADGQHQRIIDYDDLLGVITGKLSSYTLLISPEDPMSPQVTISRVQGEDE